MKAPLPAGETIALRLGVLEHAEGLRLQEHCTLRCFITLDNMSVICPLYSRCATKLIKMPILTRGMADRPAKKQS